MHEIFVLTYGLIQIRRSHDCPRAAVTCQLLLDSGRHLLRAGRSPSRRPGQLDRIMLLLLVDICGYRTLGARCPPTNAFFNKKSNKLLRVQLFLFLDYVQQ